MRRRTQLAALGTVVLALLGLSRSFATIRIRGDATALQPQPQPPQQREARVVPDAAPGLSPSLRLSLGGYLR